MLDERPRIAEAVDITDAVTHQRVRYFLHDRTNAVTVWRMRARPKRDIIESKGHAHRISVPLARNMCVNLAWKSRGSRPPARGSKRKRRTETGAEAACVIAMRITPRPCEAGRRCRRWSRSRSSTMSTELVEACGLKRRRKSLRAAFADAREIDQLFADLDSSQ
jgi:hypothetical protein